MRVLIRAAALALPLSTVGCTDSAVPVDQILAVAAPVGVNSAEPNLEVSPNGTVYLTWLEPRDSGHVLQFAELRGSSWSAPRVIAEGRRWFVNWADFPSLLALSDSILVAHWLVRSALSPYAYDVVVSRSTDAGTSWSEPVTPHRDGTHSEHGFVSFWPLGNGRAGLVWLDGRKYAAAEAAQRRGDSTVVAEMSLRTATMEADGSVGPESELDGRICDCCQTSAAVTSEGPVVVYRDRSLSDVRDTWIVRQVNGTWTQPAPVANDGWVINSCPVNGPAVAAQGRRVAVAWYSQAADRRRVYVAFSEDAGASFSRRVRVDDGRPVGRVDVVMLRDGRALVSWIEDNPEGGELRIKLVSRSGSGPARVVTRTAVGRPAGFPRMVASGDRLVFAWTDVSADGSTAVRTALAAIVR